MAAAAVAKGEMPELQELAVGVVLMSDDELLALNVSSLGHDWYTDILTFEVDRSEEMLEAELYLSVDRAKENAAKAGIADASELALLVVHGMLHLAGFDDHETAAKKRMRARERFYLAQIRS